MSDEHGYLPLMGMRPRRLRYLLNGLSDEQRRAIRDDFVSETWDGQREPGGDWRVWLLMAGRGYGKTRTGAEWVLRRARQDGTLRIALVGASVDEVRDVMVLGDSGLMKCATPDEEMLWVPSRRLVVFPSGAEAYAYSGQSPEKLRGPQHHIAWCDEIAKWARPEATWANLQLGLRLGAKPQIMVTTTPRAVPLLKRIAKAEGTHVTRGRTEENDTLAPGFAAAMRAMYGRSRFGREELDGELIEDVEGALWSRDGIEAARVAEAPAILRCVVGVDPPAGAGAASDACGIVAAGVGADGRGYVLGDHSVQGLGPEGWARAVAAAAEVHGADRVIAEANNGGAMVESVLRAADQRLPLRLVHASRGKSARAEPVAALFEAGRARLAGVFPALEDELCGLLIGGGYEGPGRSPDRADAMVWAMTELMLGAEQRPGVRRL
jgi:phage terminase large subunit-like protein